MILLMQITTHPRVRAFTARVAIFLSLAFTDPARADKVTLVAGGTRGDGRLRPPTHAPRKILSHINGRRGVVKLEARLDNDPTLTAGLIDDQPAC